MPRAVRRSRIEGPYPIWHALAPARPGTRWIYLTSLEHCTFDLVSGGKVSYPMAYLEVLPPVGQLTYVQYKAEIDAMIDEAHDRQKPSKWVMPAEPMLAGLENLARYLTDFWWEKPTVKPRIPCKLAIQFFGEAVQVTMNDEEKRRSTHTTAQTVREALELLDARLGAGEAPWRQWGKQK